MSIQASNWAWQQQLAHPTSKFLLVLLADRANENPDYADLVGERHVTWLSVGRMAEKLGVGETTIKSHLNVLEGRGLIRRFARFRENGSRTTNLIILACDETGGVPWADGEGGRSADPGGGQRSDPPEPSGNNHQEEPESNPSAAAPPPLVEPEIVDAEIVDDEACPPPPPVQENAGTMLAAWIDYCRARGVQMTPTTIKRYGAKFKELLAAGFAKHLIGAALQAMCRDNVISKVHLIDHYVTRAQTGPERRPQDVRTKQEVRNDEMGDVLQRAQDLVVSRGGKPNDYTAMMQAVDEIKAGLVAPPWGVRELAHA